MTQKTNNNGCLAILLSIFGVGKKAEPVPDPEDEQVILAYQKIESLITEGEMPFYRVLKSAVGSKLVICPKVDMKSVVKAAIPSGDWTAYNKIKEKHVDFLLCKPDTMEPWLAIELQDSSHNRTKQQKRDQEKRSALKSAGVPLLEVQWHASYDPKKLQQQMIEAVKSQQQAQ